MPSELVLLALAEGFESTTSGLWKSPCPEVIRGEATVVAGGRRGRAADWLVEVGEACGCEWL